MKSLSNFGHFFRHEVAQLRTQLVDDKLKSKSVHAPISSKTLPRTKDPVSSSTVGHGGTHAVWSGGPDPGPRDSERSKNWKATNSNEWIKTEKFGGVSKSERTGNSLQPTRVVNEISRAELTDAIAPMRAVEANSIDVVEIEARDRQVHSSSHRGEGHHDSSSAASESSSPLTSHHTSAASESRSPLTSHHNLHDFSLFESTIQGTVVHLIILYVNTSEAKQM